VIVLAVAAATFLSTFLGGLLALRTTTHVGMVIALGAGVRVGAAFFDLGPEAAEAMDSVENAMIFAAIGFLIFYLLERITLIHVGHEAGMAVDRHEHVGTLGAGGMSVHSFLDGLAVGAAFHAGTELGIIIAIVVILHDFSDGIGTVSVLLANDASRRTAFRWLVVDALAPVAGVLAAFAINIEGAALGALLGLFMGFFLYVAGAELLPEAHRKESGWMVLAATLVGAALIFGVTQVIAI
jgi:zinc and cadmium transporter